MVDDSSHPSNPQASVAPTADPASRSVEDYVGAGQRAHTQRSYAAGVRHYEVTWGGLLPATPQRVAEYLAAYGPTLAINTLKSRLAALAHWHADQGFADPTRAPIVRQTLKGIRTVHAGRERQADPLQLRDLTHLDDWFAIAIETADGRGDRPSALRLRRDRALIFLGFWRGFRGDELLRIQTADLALVPGQGFTLYLSRSKGDRQAAGTTYRVPAISRLCPVTAVQAWIDAAALRDGSLFRAIDRWGSVRPGALHANSLIGVLRRVFTRAGLAAANTYSSHSLRRGFAGWASANGWDVKSLMEYVGWKNAQSAMRYVDIPDAFGQARIEQALGTPTPPRRALPPPPTPETRSIFAIDLTLRLSPLRPRASVASARRTIEFVCLQRHGAVADDAERSRYRLRVAATDETDLSETIATLIDDIHRIADNHGAVADTFAVGEGGTIRWD